MKKKKARIILENILVTDYAAEGKALARHDGKVIFISGAVPGDTADILLTKNKLVIALVNTDRILAKGLLIIMIRFMVVYKNQLMI